MKLIYCRNNSQTVLGCEIEQFNEIKYVIIILND